MTTLRAGVPTEVRLTACNRDVVLLRAAVETLVRELDLLAVDFLPLELLALERPALDFELERPALLDLDPLLDLPRELLELERPLDLDPPLDRPLLERPLLERPPRAAIIFYAPLKFSKVKFPLMRSPRT